MDDDEGMERGDETPRWPPIGSPEWRARLARASIELKQAEREIFEHYAQIHVGVRTLFRELES